MNFFYSFTETLLHSLWQSALLLFACYFLLLFFKFLHPLFKRNLFYGAIGLQVFISTFTFLYIYSSTNFSEWFVFNIGLLLNNQQQAWFQNNAILIFSIYILIVFAKLFSMWLQWYRFNKLYTKALIKPSASLKIFTKVKALQLGIKKNIGIWYSQHVETPVTFGFLKPIILLPISLVNNLTITETESIILHELAHVKNNDYLLNWLLMVVDALYFFNPFMKILTHKIKVEREKNCDVQVIHFGYDPLQYSQALLKVAKHNNPSAAFQLAAAKNSNQLLNRIKFFTDEKKFFFKNISPVLIWTLFLIMMGICLWPLNKQEILKTSTNASTKIISNSFIPENDIALKNEVAHQGGEIKKVILTQDVAFTRTASEPVEGINVSDKNFIEETSSADENIFSTVAFAKAVDSVKEVTINLETQQGNITQVYKLTLVNGTWLVQPQWMLVEKNADSISIKMRDSLVNKLDSIQ